LEEETGVKGFGEAAPFEAPFYSPETIDSALSCLTKELLPRLLEQPVSTSAELDSLLTDGVRGNEMARAGAETAWWDLLAAIHGVPLVELISARLRDLTVPERWCRSRDHVECGIALGIPHEASLDTLSRQATAAVERGYRRIKIKIRPGWDAEPVRAVQDALRSAGRSLPITVDANGSYDLERDGAALRDLDDMGLLYIEQPLPPDALWDLCELAGELKTPVCIDETLTSDTVARQVVAMDGPSVWNVKVQRLGGLEQCCRIYARAVRAGVKLWAGTMPETGLGAQATLALASHVGFVYPSDIEPSSRWYRSGTDLVELVMGARGAMKVPRTRCKPDLSGPISVVWEAAAP
jgi:O-succinylbenzoate synthase